MGIVKLWNLLKNWFNHKEGFPPRNPTEVDLLTNLKEENNMPLEGNDVQLQTDTQGTPVPGQEEKVLDTLQQIKQDVAPLEPMTQVAADVVQAAVPGIDFEKSYHELLAAYNDSQNAYETLKKDYEALKEAAVKHSNIITHFANLFKEIF